MEECRSVRLGEEGVVVDVLSFGSRVRGLGNDGVEGVAEKVETDPGELQRVGVGGLAYKEAARGDIGVLGGTGDIGPRRESLGTTISVRWRFFRINLSET